VFDGGGGADVQQRAAPKTRNARRSGAALNIVEFVHEEFAHVLFVLTPEIAGQHP
jgi:hypothetical protein